MGDKLMNKVTLIIWCIFSLISIKSYASVSTEMSCPDSNDGVDAFFQRLTTGHRGYDTHQYNFTIYNQATIKHFLETDAVNFTNGQELLFNLAPIEGSDGHFRATALSTNDRVYYIKYEHGGFKIEAFYGDTASRETFLADWFFADCK